MKFFFSFHVFPSQRYLSSPLSPPPLLLPYISGQVFLSASFLVCFYKNLGRTCLCGYLFLFFSFLQFLKVPQLSLIFLFKVQFLHKYQIFSNNGNFCYYVCSHLKINNRIIIIGDYNVIIVSPKITLIKENQFLWVTILIIY